MARNKTVNESRHVLLGWVNDCLHSNLRSVEELCTGAAYCQIIEQLFPNSVPMKRIKLNAHNENECTENFKTLQKLFKRIGIDKAIPIDRLVKGRFKDNFEFLKWFKSVFHHMDKTSRKSQESVDLPKRHSDAAARRLSGLVMKPLPNDKVSPVGQAAPSSSIGEERTVEDLKNQISLMKTMIQELMNERNILCGQLQDLSDTVILLQTGGPYSLLNRLAKMKEEVEE